MKDLKESLGSGAKPDITHVRTPIMNAIARACEYGSAKYERSNFLRETGSPAEDFERLRAYLRASVSHVYKVLDSMEAHQSSDPQLEDVEGMRAAAFAADDDPDRSGKVGPSMLPHVCGAAASLNMALAQAAACGLLPEDPGQPWTDTATNAHYMGGPADVTISFDHTGAKSAEPEAALKPWQCRRPRADALSDPEASCACVGCVRTGGAGGFPGTYRQSKPNWGFSSCDRCGKQHRCHLPNGRCPADVTISFDHTGAKSDVADPPEPSQVFSPHRHGPTLCIRCGNFENAHVGSVKLCPL